jgi:hypothetical protein
MTRALSLCVVAALALAACSPAGALCRKQQECAPEQNDEMDDESVVVCEVAFDVHVRSLRENDEIECQEQADRELDYARCLSGLACADFVEPDTNGLCESEQKALDDARRAAESECASTD